MKVLLISHNFSPMESPEAIRSEKYAKYLNRFGFNLFVLNTPRKEGGLFRRVLAHYDIIPDAYKKWIQPAYKEACKIIEDEKIDIILSRSMPIVSHKIVLKLKEKYPQIPWIAEFSDPWTANNYKKYPFSFGKRKDKKIEQQIFLEANKIIATSFRTADLFKKQYPWAEAKVKTIPNFYDEEEFNNINEGITKVPGKFIVIHTGNFYGIRTPEYLFKALKELEQQNITSIIVLLVGNLGKYKKLIKKYNISNEILQIKETVNRLKAIELLKYADAYLLIDAPSKEPSVFLPSKLPEYLYMRRPILALTSEGTVKDIISKETKTGICVSSYNIGEIALALKYLPTLVINKEANIEKYNAMNCVWDLALIIKELIKDGELKDNKCLCGETELSEDSTFNESL
jgi:glycosyltransferase involved in cell wall biosynthesis